MTVFSVSGINFAVKHLTIANGRNDFGGAGLFSDNGTLSVIKSTFPGSGNCYLSEGDCPGGGIEQMGGSLSVTNSAFTANSSGILNLGTSTVTNSTFTGNGGGDCRAGGVPLSRADGARGAQMA